MSKKIIVPRGFVLLQELEDGEKVNIIFVFYNYIINVIN